MFIAGLTIKQNMHDLGSSREVTIEKFHSRIFSGVSVVKLHENDETGQAEQ